MEISRKQHDGYLELSFDGRLDAYWAQHLAASADEVMREGSHTVRLNLSRTSYISSAGIGTLVSLFKQFKAVNGAFHVVDPSPLVKHTLGMVGLTDMLSGTAVSSKSAAAAKPARVERVEAGGAVFEMHEPLAGAGLRCSPVG